MIQRRTVLIAGWPRLSAAAQSAMGKEGRSDAELALGLVESLG